MMQQEGWEHIIACHVRENPVSTKIKYRKDIPPSSEQIEYKPMMPEAYIHFYSRKQEQ
jgi:hypothetical protein